MNRRWRRCPTYWKDITPSPVAAVSGPLTCVHCGVVEILNVFLLVFSVIFRGYRGNSESTNVMMCTVLTAEIKELKAASEMLK